MKKITLLFSALLGMYGLNAQNLDLNLDDPNWVAGSCGNNINYENPGPANFWVTMNQLCALGSPIVTVTKTSDAVSGQAAVLRTQILGTANADSTPGFLSRLVPGLINSGTLDVNNTFNPLQQGKPFTSRPACFEGYYKYSPIFGDSAAIYVKLALSGQTVGTAYISVTQAVNNYTFFSIPVNYVNSSNPDSINVVLVSSAGSQDNKGRKGSRLWVDEIHIGTCTVGIEDKAIVLGQVFPNPASNDLTISLAENVSSGDFQLFNVEGKLVKSAFLSSMETTLSLNDLPNGMYFYTLVSQDGKRMSGKLDISKN